MSQGRVTGKRILLADDQQDVRETLKLLLRVDAHNVTEAKDGQEAWELYRPGSFDLVITDHVMPRMQGDELALRIKQLASSQPILMITAYSERLGHCADRVDAVLSKPFTFEALRAAIAQLISQAPSATR
jgi:CheY-like chemotaxis protein